MQFVLSAVIWLGFAGLLASSWRFLNRARGMGAADRPKLLPNKAVILTLMALLSSAQTVVAANQNYADILAWWGYALVVGAEILAVNLLFRPTWGEIFPDTNDTYQEDFAFGVREIADALAGYRYDAKTAGQNDKELFWKIVAWWPRFGLYGIPFAALKCAAAASLAPMAIWFFGCMFIGVIYMRARYGFDGQNSWIAEAEKCNGFFLGVLSATMLIP